MNHQLLNQFQNAARNIKHSNDKLVDLSRNILSHKDFAAVAGNDPASTRYLLRDALSPLDGAETWKAVMEFIQTDGARAMAKSIRPEYMVEILAEARKKMSADDKEFIDVFLPQTDAGKTLFAAYPAARIKLRFG